MTRVGIELLGQLRNENKTAKFYKLVKTEIFSGQSLYHGSCPKITFSVEVCTFWFLVSIYNNYIYCSKKIIEQIAKCQIFYTEKKSKHLKGRSVPPVGDGF